MFGNLTTPLDQYEYVPLGRPAYLGGDNSKDNPLVLRTNKVGLF